MSLEGATFYPAIQTTLLTAGKHLKRDNKSEEKRETKNQTRHKRIGESAEGLHVLQIKCHACFASTVPDW